jgi:cysteine-rich repeat protein
MRLWIAFAALSCKSPTHDPPPVVPEPEAAALCGDGALEGAEACDDGNSLGGDGCLPDCTAEPDPREHEPNDTWDAAEPYPGEPVHGGLPEGDVDCFSIDAADCLAIHAALTGECGNDGLLSLHDPTGAVVAEGSVDASGCAVLDPQVSPGARFSDAGAQVVCVSSLTGREIPSYTLDFSASSGDVFAIGGADDPDGDGLPARCDDDRDGDGVLDVSDNCPDAPNGLGMAPLAPSDLGFLRDWLVLAPITGTDSAFSCLPSADQLPGGDANLAPRIGDRAAGLEWVGWFAPGDAFSFLPDWGFVDSPREAYVQSYLWSATTRDLTLAVGADDGVRAWLDGAVVLDIASCQGVYPDEFQAPIRLVQGWNRLTLKVRDQGGGWGMSARFFDGGAPVTDLELSLSPDGSWVDDQGDLDGDGVGDVCDVTP